MSQHKIQTEVGPLAVRDEGDGPVTVLWHSLFVDERSWSRIEADLVGERRLVLITGPGHGSSGDPGRRYTMAECAAAGTRVLDELGVDGPVDWVGNAWGGHVGLIFAATWPARCRTLVTVGTPVHSYRWRGRAEVRVLLLAYRLIGPAGFLRNGVTGALLSARTREHDPGAVAFVHECFTTADRAGLANAILSISLHRKDLTPLLPRVEAPTLFVTGTDHPDWGPEQAEAASRLLRNGSWAVFDDAAYLLPLEGPEELVEQLRRFWEADAEGAPRSQPPVKSARDLPSPWRDPDVPEVEGGRRLRRDGPQGGAVVRHLLREDWHVRAITRTPSPPGVERSPSWGPRSSLPT